MDFQFIRRGTLFSVHTEVGDGPAQVSVQERESRPVPQPAREEQPQQEPEEALC